MSILTKKRRIGDIGEAVAEKHLRGQGYKILARNWQRPCGEIDIIAQPDKKLIVFIEVKTISQKHLGHWAEDNIHWRKQQRLKRTAQVYLKEHNLAPDICWRIDCISVYLNLQIRRADICHKKNAIF